ncbi:MULTISPECIES: pantetheine-phosphate adenylyltransferase [Aureimonas]|uniref:Phosphopantetheine adenylyltransferase n=1 Tax=Aureimonas ureilytica TaxID=401562 RepID=A0A175R7B5_9HYPH|nr:MULTISPECIES: pantetheine-phosphate adenylyltransferase [Aureimonas]KTQ88915.1 phosphopantetheine adenylyltransferase [Aureimonas ureilytica]
MRRVALFAGSFDPLTNGHLDVLTQASRLFDRIVVSIGIHPGKAPLFSADERAALVRRALEAERLDAEIVVSFFQGLTVDEAHRHGATALLRGIRDGGDFDYEMQLAGMNARLAPDVGTIFLPASIETRPITATLVRQIASLGGDVSAFVPPVVAEALREKFVRH